MMSYSCFWW